MRATVVGLIALPATAAGLVVAATVMGSGNEDAPPAAPERTTTVSTGGGSDTADETRVAAPEPVGTAIEGVRPHLTVIDGLSALPVPAPIPSILSRLSARPADLVPLPPPTDGRTEPARSGFVAGDGANRGRNPDTVDRNEPLGSAGSGAGDIPPGVTDHRAPRPGRDHPATPSPMDDGPEGELPTGEGDRDDDPAEGTPDRPEHPTGRDAPVVIGPVPGARIVVLTTGAPAENTPVEGTPAPATPTDGSPADGEPGAAHPADDGSEPR